MESRTKLLEKLLDFLTIEGDREVPQKQGGLEGLLGQEGEQDEIAELPSLEGEPKAAKVSVLEIAQGEDQEESSDGEENPFKKKAKGLI